MAKKITYHKTRPVIICGRISKAMSQEIQNLAEAAAVSRSDIVRVALITLLDTRYPIREITENITRN